MDAKHDLLDVRLPRAIRADLSLWIALFRPRKEEMAVVTRRVVAMSNSCAARIALAVLQKIKP